MFFVCALAIAVGIGLLLVDESKPDVDKHRVIKNSVNKQNVDKPKVDTDKKTFGAESPATVVQAFRTAAKEKNGIVHCVC